MNEKSYEMTSDTLQTKIYDSKLIGKLLKYLKPYKKLVAVSFLLLFVLTGIELILPLIIKTAVDDHIVPSRNLIVFDDQAEFDAFRQRNPKVKINIYEHQGNIFVIFPTDVERHFRTNELQSLTEAGNRIPGNFYIVANEPRAREILQNSPYYPISEEQIIVNQEIVEQLDNQDIHVLREPSRRALFLFGILFLSLVIFRVIVSFFQIYITHYFSQRAMYDLRQDAFVHLEKMPSSFFDKNPIGRLVTRVTSDVRALDELLSEGLITMAQDFLILIGIIILMLALNWRLALVSYTVVPFVYLLVRHFKVKTRIVYREVRKRVAMLNAALAEDISGIRIIKLFNQYGNKCRQFGNINQSYYEASMAQLKLFAFFRPLIGISRHIAIAIILWYGGGQIIRNTLSLGMLMAFIRYMERFFEPVNHLSEKFNVLQAAMSGAERVFDLIEKEPQDYRDSLTKNIKFNGDIEFRDIWLTYNLNEKPQEKCKPEYLYKETPEDGNVELVSSCTDRSIADKKYQQNEEHDYVLKNINFSIKAGEKIALVGHTGSGKTSIINLISEMYPHQKGDIIIDGKSIKEYSIFDIRNNIGIVQQDVFLFSGTIRDNIILNNKNISDEEMLKIAKYVNVDYFVSRLPQKYDEPVMERGATLSVGQRQLIAFARVLAYNPSIFILDEATSNIDTETELLIQDALKKVMANRTSIIIAHRLSTIQNVDRIIVLHKGKIIEQGHHNQLISNRNLYFDLYRLQYA
jgi:ATP-binding cassette, subfamily B, multidrug efflux pump